MVEEIYNELLKRYLMSKEVLEAQEEEPKQYDIRLLTISIKDIGDSDSLAKRVIELRYRKEEDKNEELVIVSATVGGTREITDIHTDLKVTAEMIVSFTEKLVEEFNKVLIWNYLGD